MSFFLLGGRGVENEEARERGRERGRESDRGKLIVKQIMTEKESIDRGKRREGKC